MRITLEADYAIRATFCLASVGKKITAKEISEQTGITLRFSLKILHKLMQAEIVKSFKGVNGGYILGREPNEISVGQIIEAIDGPIQINHCLNNEFDCTRVSNKPDCGFYRVFTRLNSSLRDELYHLTMDQFL